MARSRSIFERRRQAFGESAELYDRVRPSYPHKAIVWMLGEPPLRVVDLGAGTGIFTRALAALGHDVTAVEPDALMRARLAETSPGLTVLDGSAESIPLPDAAVDAVTAAQAFHWFDNEAALAEIARVLAPAGVFAPIWNVRDESVDWVREMSSIVEPGTGVATSDHARAGRAFGPHFEQPERAEFDHDPVLHTTESLLDHARSRSPYLSASPEERRRMEARLTALVRDLPEPFELPYFTVAFRARRRG